MRALLTLLCATAAFGQPRYEFEVASIKPSAIRSDNSVDIGVHIDGAQVHISTLSLRDYIGAAYRIRPYQITGPDWLPQTKFEVDAKIPDGVPRDKVPEMIQSLLEDRFQMKAHRTSKEFPVYAITVAGPLKLKESPVDANAPAAGTPPPAVQIAASGGPGGVNMNMGGGASFRFADNRLEVVKLTFPVLADRLAMFFDKPVVDQTGLTGRYDFAIDLAPEDYRAMLIRSAVNAGVVLPPQALQLLEGGNAASLIGGMRDLGIKMEARKAPLDVVVIDSMNKAPSGN